MFQYVKKCVTMGAMFETKDFPRPRIIYNKYDYNWTRARSSSPVVPLQVSNCNFDIDLLMNFKFVFSHLC